MVTEMPMSEDMQSIPDMNDYRALRIYVITGDPILSLNNLFSILI